MGWFRSIASAFLLLTTSRVARGLSLTQSPQPSFRNIVPQSSSRLLSCSLALAIALVSQPLDTFAAAEEGGKLFEANCVACHPGGSNVVGYARGKTLKAKALSSNGYTDEGSIFNLLQGGKGIMPGFGDYTRFDGVAVPRQLSDAEMMSLASFVLQQAAADWK
mmetsp:Transcript_12024/g.28169  ORF Transcript_12024/g.28169 Transcript_12024/m.28169 type:complete len:163 (+) Transcript_12024:74-562(+)